MTAGDAPPTSSSGRQILKQGNAFLVMDRVGNVPGTDGFGLYLEDTRHLARYALSLREGRLSSSSIEAPDTYSTRIDLLVDSRGSDPGLSVTREMILSSHLLERLHIRNLGGAARTLTLTLSLGADFKDIFEVRGIVPAQRRAPRIVRREDGIRWERRGRDGVWRWTQASLEPPPVDIGQRSAIWHLELGPEGSTSLRIKMDFGTGKVPAVAGVASPKKLARAVERIRATQLRPWAGLEVDNERLGAWLGRSMSDAVDLLITVEGHEIPAAGLPWYATLFGRDSLIFGLETLPFNPRMSMEVLRSLASLQGRRHDPHRGEEPGKILHELRRGELAGSHQIPHTPYYGSIDATPLFLCLLSEVYRWSADVEFCRGLYPSALAAAQYIQGRLEEDPNGFLGYAGDIPPGLRHQGWKDSDVGVLHSDGSQPEPPIALCEVQGYVYWGLRGLARVAQALKDEAKARSLEATADALGNRFERAFWMNASDNYAFALDGRGDQVRTQTSNPGHLLMCRILSPERAERVAARLSEEDFFSGWGVRTMSALEDLYDPLSYHNGSVWPHDTAILAWGMSRYGLQQGAASLFEGLLEAAECFRYRLPELFAGLPRRGKDKPVAVPRACDLTAWVAGSPFLMLRGLLGLDVDAPSRRLRVDPFLPVRTDHIRIRSLRVGNTDLDVRVERVGTELKVSTSRVEGGEVIV